MQTESSVTLTRRIAKGKQIFMQGEPGSAAYILLRGKIALSIGLQHGRQIPLFRQDSGSVLGLAEALLGIEYQTTATAATNVTVHMISRADLLDMVKDPESGITVLSILTGKLSQLYQVLRKTTRGRHSNGPSLQPTGPRTGSHETKPTVH